MKFVDWLKNRFQKEYTLTREEIIEEIKITEYQITVGIEVAKANPNHPQLWDSVFFRTDELKRLNDLLNKME